MKENTKRNLKVVGGIVLGVGLLATGQFMFGMAVGGLAIRSGVSTPGMALSTELAKKAGSKMIIAGDLIRGTICTVAGAKILAETAATVIVKEPKVSVVAPPPDRTPRTIIDADIVS